jgi:carbon-monoxide dehydrogenase large subunit
VSVDTSRGVYGSGSWGSRVSVVAGGAVVNAAAVVADKIRAIAAGVLDVPADATHIADDGSVRGPDGQAISLREVCEIAYFSPRRLPAGVTPGLGAFESYAVNPITTAPYAWHACIVELDTRTAALRILRYVVVSDSGTVINPVHLDEQIRGGISQGIGETLFEAIEFDEHGRTAGRDLFGYRAPRGGDMPEEIQIRHIETPSPLNVFGVKGGGENGAIGAPGAVAVAITDALWDTGFRVDALPVRFDDLVRAAAASAAAHSTVGGA